jgi:hypothetical protein
VEKVWLPYYYESRARGLKPHPYCIDCGLIKNLSSCRSHNIGYFMNIVAELSKEYKIAQVQIRLIAMELEKQGIEDNFGMDRNQQEDLFTQIATRILNIPKRVVREKLDRICYMR